jgi:hypothetical protein
MRAGRWIAAALPMLALLPASSRAQAPEIICARNFSVGGMYGLIEQGQNPPPAGGPIRFALWRDGVRAEWWQVRPDAPNLDRPGWLTWEVELTLSRRQTLRARYWADGIAVGQDLFLPAAAVPPAGERFGRTVRLEDPAILRRLLAARVREVEIVGEGGVSLLRWRLPFASPAALRAGFARQVAWLAGARRTRPALACHEQADVNYES